MTLRWKIAQWFELRWWRIYLHDKDKDTYLQWKKNYWQTLLDKIARDVKIDASKSVIDLGCGPAGIFIALPKNKVTAVDPLLNEYETRTQFFRQSDYANVTFVNSTIEAFESKGSKYDVVCCMNAINHVHNMSHGFEQLKNLCAENGCIIVSIDAHNFSFFKYLFRLIPGDILHPHQYDLNEYINFLQSGTQQTMPPVLLKHEFFFDHYLLVAKKERRL
jgi:2-polyprenyl-3-methyl-5-hydroxy-6-metoxy-1,4-benzoquinol methylase